MVWFMNMSLHSRLLEENGMESSGSELLDSFYFPLQTIPCPHNQPVFDANAREEVDVSARKEADNNMPPNRALSCRSVYDFKTPRERAIQRINKVLTLDREVER